MKLVERYGTFSRMISSTLIGGFLFASGCSSGIKPIEPIQTCSHKTALTIRAIDKLILRIAVDSIIHMPISELTRAKEFSVMYGVDMAHVIYLTSLFGSEMTEKLIKQGFVRSSKPSTCYPDQNTRFVGLFIAYDFEVVSMAIKILRQDGTTMDYNHATLIDHLEQQCKLIESSL